MKKGQGLFLRKDRTGPFLCLKFENLETIKKISQIGRKGVIYYG